MALANPKSNSLLSDLAPSLEAGELLMTDIQKQTFLREVRQLPNAYQALAIEGIILLLDGQHSRGMDTMEKSLRLCSQDSVSWANYASTLANRLLYAKLEEVLNRTLDLHMVDMAHMALKFGAFWADLTMMTRAVELMDKAGYVHDDSIEPSLKLMDILSHFDTDTSNELAKLASIVMSIAEREELSGKESRIEGDGDGVYSFSVCIEVDDPHYLSKLNSEIIQSMVGAGLDSSNCVAFFEVGQE